MTGPLTASVTLTTLVCLLVLPGPAPATTGMILADHQGGILFEQNADTPMIPASCLKVVTALAALDILGESHRFTTACFQSPDHFLILQGGGDPLLTSRELRSMARETALRLKQEGIRPAGIRVDDTVFSSDITIPGTGNSLNPYDAPVGGLSVNFNTICFETGPGGRFVSGETETPLTAYGLHMAEKSGLSSGRIPLDQGEAGTYAADLFRVMLMETGLTITDRIAARAVGNRDRRIILWRSPYSLPEVISRMLRFSNNMMANQLLLSVSARVSGTPADLESACRVVEGWARKRHFTPITIKEGSGISRKNRITPRGLLSVVRAFTPYHRLMRRQNGMFFKTGTLQGVHTRCGFIIGPKHRLFPFAVMGCKTRKDVRRRLDRLKEICRETL